MHQNTTTTTTTTVLATVVEECSSVGESGSSSSSASSPSSNASRDSMLIEKDENSSYKSRIFVNRGLLAVGPPISDLQDRQNLGIRRSSSLHLPGETWSNRSSVISRTSSRRRYSPSGHAQQQQQQQQHRQFFANAIETLKCSTHTLYSSTLNIGAGILFGAEQDMWLQPRFSRHKSVDYEPMNLYDMMAKFRCFFGLFRLRIATLLLGLISTGISFSGICILSSTWLARILPPDNLRTLTLPGNAVCGLTLLTSVLLLCGLFLEIQYLMLPFLITCLVNVGASLTLEVFLLIHADRFFNVLEMGLWPALFYGLGTILVCLYLWFLVLASFTYALIRDKRRVIEEEGLLRMCAEGECDKLIQFDRVNSAEF